MCSGVQVQPLPKVLPRGVVRKTPLRPGTKRLGHNRARKASELLRCYGPPARRAFVKSLPCCICGTIPSENAHAKGDGMSRKADYVWIVPACRVHHREMHAGIESFQDRYGIDLWRVAEQTEARWQQAQNAERAS